MPANYIGEKLDFLMKLTDTSNTALAKALNFDSSHISRIRSGQRGLPRQKSFLEPVSELFARKIKEPFQIKGAEDAICPGRSWPKRPSAQAALISAWLTSETVEAPFFAGKDPACGARTTAGGAKAETVSSTGMFSGAEEGPGRRTANVFYYGSEGRRQAVIRFLEEVLQAPGPVRMLLYSDEDISWMTEDPEFARRWLSLMSRFTGAGGTITMIHSINRSLGEMIDAVREWMPLYMSGAIDPWFCPRLRDDLFRQTRFVAPGVGAILGGSVGSGPAGSSSIYIEDPAMVDRLKLEFETFLGYCRPLMRIYRREDRDVLTEDVGQFEAMEGSLLAIPMPWGGASFIKEKAAVIFSGPENTTAFAIKEAALVSGLWETARRAEHLTDERAAALLDECKKAFGLEDL